jgi:hypothetical protein
MIMCACLWQFNCLEMVGPSVRPEDGITGYAGDPTQVCVCAHTDGDPCIVLRGQCVSFLPLAHTPVSPCVIGRDQRAPSCVRQPPCIATTS